MRVRDWQSKLQAFLVERRFAPFAWGTNDCAIFSCDAVLAQTGHDPAEGMRDHRDAKQATEILRTGGGLEKIADDRLGQIVAPLMAQVGDVGLTTVDDRPTLVICGGDHWVGPGQNGIISLRMALITKVWRT